MLTAAEIEAEARRRSGFMVTIEVSGSRAVIVHPHGVRAEFEVTREDRKLPIGQFFDKRLAEPLATMAKIING